MTTDVESDAQVREFANRMRTCLNDLAKRSMTQARLTAIEVGDWLGRAYDIVDHFDSQLKPAPMLMVHHIDRLPAVCRHALTTEFYADRPITYVAPSALEAGDIVELLDFDIVEKATDLRIAFGGALMRLAAVVTCPSCGVRVAAKLVVPTDRSGYVLRRCTSCHHSWRQWPAFA